MIVLLLSRRLVGQTRSLAALVALVALLLPSAIARASLVVPPTTSRQESLTIAERELDYQVTAGFVPLAADDSSTAAQVYYTAYTRESAPDAPPRPVAIAFNGGPGASSLYLHLLGLAPQRLDLDDEGRLPAGAPRLTANPDTWLTFADLVFVDPPGTGFSPLSDASDAERHFDLRGDAEIMGEFIRHYLHQIGRPDAPVYLVGESYGGTRAVLLATEQVRAPDFDLRGLILISPVLDYQFLDPRATGNLKLALTLPTLAATARYHDQLGLAPGRGWDAWLTNIEAWAIRTYLPALVEGDRLSPRQRRAIARQLARYTGLPAERFASRELRLTAQYFGDRLLPGRRLDRWDSRFTYTTISPLDHLEEAMAAAWSEYATQYLGLEADYVVFSQAVNQTWRWDNRPFNLDLAPLLGATLERQPDLRLFVAAGYYDLVVPFAAVNYSLNRLGLPPDEREHIQLRYYAAGHMVYLPADERQRLRDEVAAFLALEPPALGDRPHPERPLYGR